MKYLHSRTAAFVKRASEKIKNDVKLYTKSEIKLFTKASLIATAGAVGLYAADQLVEKKFPEEKGLGNTLTRVAFIFGIYGYGFKKIFSLNIEKEGRLLQVVSCDLNESGDLTLKGVMPKGVKENPCGLEEYNNYKVNEKPGHFQTEGIRNMFSVAAHFLNVGISCSAPIVLISKTCMKLFTSRKMKIFNLPYFMVLSVYQKPAMAFQYYTRPNLSVARTENGVTQEVGLQGGETLSQYLYENFKYSLKSNYAAMGAILSFFSKGFFEMPESRHNNRFRSLGRAEIVNGEYTYKILLDARKKTLEDKYEEMMENIPKEGGSRIEEKSLDYPESKSGENSEDMHPGFPLENSQKTIVQETENHAEDCLKAPSFLPTNFNEIGKNSAIVI